MFVLITSAMGLFQDPLIRPQKCVFERVGSEKLPTALPVRLHFEPEEVVPVLKNLPLISLEKNRSLIGFQNPLLQFGIGHIKFHYQDLALPIVELLLIDLIQDPIDLEDFSDHIQDHNIVGRLDSSNQLLELLRPQLQLLVIVPVDLGSLEIL